MDLESTTPSDHDATIFEDLYSYQNSSFCSFALDLTYWTCLSMWLDVTPAPLTISYAILVEGMEINTKTEKDQQNSSLDSALFCYVHLSRDPLAVNEVLVLFLFFSPMNTPDMTERKKRECMYQEKKFSHLQNIY